MGGGTPDGFMDFTISDAQVLISTAEGLHIRDRSEILKGICKMFGGDAED